jgi:hypothetical protein
MVCPEVVHPLRPLVAVGAVGRAQIETTDPHLAVKLVVGQGVDDRGGRRGGGGAIAERFGRPRPRSCQASADVAVAPVPAVAMTTISREIDTYLQDHLILELTDVTPEVGDAITNCAVGGRQGPRQEAGVPTRRLLPQRHGRGNRRRKPTLTASARVPRQ